MTGPDADSHRVGVTGLHANDPDVRTQRLEIGGNATDKATATDGDEDGIDVPGMLSQNLHPDSPLTGDDIGVIEGVDDGQAPLLGQDGGSAVGVAVGLTMEHDLRSGRPHRIDLDARCRHRHDDDGVAPQPVRREGHALRVVAGRGGHDPCRQRRRGQLRHLVVGAADLEREDRVQILALEQHLVPQARAQSRGGIERRLRDDVVDRGGEDAFEVGRRIRVGGS